MYPSRFRDWVVGGKKTKLASAMEPRAPRSLPPFRQWRGVEEVDPVNPGRGYTHD